MVCSSLRIRVCAHSYKLALIRVRVGLTGAITHPDPSRRGRDGDLQPTSSVLADAFEAKTSEVEQ